MKGAGKRNKGRLGWHRRGVMVQPVSKSEKDNIMDTPAAVAHLYLEEYGRADITLDLQF